MASAVADGHAQEFVPTRPDLALVEVLLSTERLRGQRPEHNTLNIRQGGIDGPIVGSSTVTIDGERDRTQFWQPFALTPPLAVEPGAPYVIELLPSTQSTLWF